MITSPLPVDPALPAAVHLAGDDAQSVLDAAVAAAGGSLLGARARHIQYRPGSDVVVRFDATVSWAGGAATRETLLAATSPLGAPAGTVPVVADVDGARLEVGVWRWPFDPVLPALVTMARPDLAAAALAGVTTGPVRLDVVAFRPTERAVVRVTDAAGVVRYVKVLAPDRVAALVDRHQRLARAGVPVAPVVAHDATAGWLATAEVVGDTVRDRLKAPSGTLPEPGEYLRIVDAFGSVELGPRSVPTRTADAFGHAAMLAAVAPEHRPAIERITARLAPALARAEARRGNVHGDLHEAQLVLTGVSITGALDVDDAGYGDPLDDLATLVAHCRFRRLTATDPRAAGRLGAYADRLAAAFARSVAARGTDPGELATVTAAVLVGLATGPYRVQQAGWGDVVGRLLAEAERLLGVRDASHERSLIAGSSPRHRTMREQTLTSRSDTHHLTHTV